MNATEIAATLSVRAADVCRRYLPRPQTGQLDRRHKRLQGALALCAPSPPGIPEKWTDAATNKWISARSHFCAPAEHQAAPRHGGGQRLLVRLPLPPLAAITPAYDHEEAARRL